MPNPALLTSPFGPAQPIPVGAGGVAPVDEPATRRRVEALERQVRDRPDVASVSGYYDTRSRAFISRDGRSTYFAVALKATEDKELQEVGADIADQLSGPMLAHEIDVAGVGGTLTANALALAAIRATLSSSLRDEDFARAIPLAERFTEAEQEHGDEDLAATFRLSTPDRG